MPSDHSKYPVSACGSVVSPAKPWAAHAALRRRRAPVADVVLDHPSISRLHAAVCYEGRAHAWRVLDLGSAHGTFVDGRPVGKARGAHCTRPACCTAPLLTAGPRARHVACPAPELHAASAGEGWRPARGGPGRRVWAVSDSGRPADTARSGLKLRLPHCPFECLRTIARSVPGQRARQLVSLRSPLCRLVLPPPLQIRASAVCVCGLLSERRQPYTLRCRTRPRSCARAAACGSRRRRGSTRSARQRRRRPHRPTLPRPAARRRLATPAAATPGGPWCGRTRVLRTRPSVACARTDVAHAHMKHLATSRTLGKVA